MPFCVRALNNGNLRETVPFDGSGTQGNCKFVIEQQSEYSPTAGASLLEGQDLGPLFASTLVFFVICWGMRMLRKQFIGG